MQASGGGTGAGGGNGRAGPFRPHLSGRNLPWNECASSTVPLNAHDSPWRSEFHPLLLITPHGSELNHGMNAVGVHPRFHSPGA
jgi:hypothetical protein